MILSTVCREKGTYHSAALLASFLAPEDTEKRLNSCEKSEKDFTASFLPDKRTFSLGFGTVNQPRFDMPSK